MIPLQVVLYTRKDGKLIMFLCYSSVLTYNIYCHPPITSFKSRLNQNVPSTLSLNQTQTASDKAPQIMYKFLT